MRGTIDGEPFESAFMAQGDGTHRLPVKADIRKAIGKEAGDTSRPPGRAADSRRSLSSSDERAAAPESARE